MMFHPVITLPVFTWVPLMMFHPVITLPAFTWIPLMMFQPVIILPSIHLGSTDDVPPCYNSPSIHLDSTDDVPPCYNSPSTYLDSLMIFHSSSPSLSSPMFSKSATFTSLASDRGSSSSGLLTGFSMLSRSRLASM